MKTVGKARFAEMVAVSKANISNLVARGKVALKGDRIDLTDPATQKYVEQREKKLGRPILKKAPAPSADTEPAPRPAPATPNQLREQVDPADIDVALDPIVDIDLDRHLKAHDLLDLDTLKRVTDIRNKEADTRLKMLRLELQRGTLVERQRVGDTAFFCIDQLNKQILDVPRKLVDDLISHVESSGEQSRVRILELLNQELCKAIQAAKSDVTRVLTEPIEEEHHVDDDAGPERPSVSD